MNYLQGKFVVLGVSGGIAAYRTCELARLLVADGAEVQPVLTRAAAELVGPLTFQALCGRPAEVGEGGRLSAAGMPHIDLARRADLILVAPATANTLAKIAWGIADNLLLSLILASRCPVLLAPAMNTRMWQDAATRENLARLRRRSRFSFIGPVSGKLACGDEGPGRMEEPVVIQQVVRRLLGPGTLRGRRILVTAGPTREPIDAVRSLTNRSSGKMGYALAAAAVRRGAETTLISGPTSLVVPWGVRLIRVETAAQMARAVEAQASRCDVLLMAAAVADFAVRRPARGKYKKASGPPHLELVPTPDILKSLAAKRKPPLLVGFAAEYGHPVAEARRKLRQKRLSLVVANDISRRDAGFEADRNRVFLVDESGAEPLPLLPKAQVAEEIWQRVEKLLTAGRGEERSRRP